MKARRYLWLGTAALGLAAGVLARKAGHPTTAGPEMPAASVAEKSRALTRSSPRETTPIPASTDTLEDLLAIQAAHELCPRLTLWLTNAGSSDCAALFDATAKRSPVDFGILRLIFYRWTQIDPHAAMAASQGKTGEREFWLAWSKVDPRAALAAGRDISPRKAADLLGTIAWENPELAKKLMAENPDIDQTTALYFMSHAISQDDPQAAIKLLEEHNLSVGRGVIICLTRDDPHAALAWILDHPRASGNDVDDAFARTISDESPELLDEIIAATPSGSLKRGLERQRFSRLAAEDPERALAMAREAESPNISTQRFLEVGSQLVDGNPDAALGILKEVYAAHPQEARRSRALVNQLIATDPVATIEAALQADSAAPDTPHSNGDTKPFGVASRSWSDYDPDSFAGWLETQEAGDIRNRGAGVLAEKFSQTGRFAEAIAWTGQLPPEYPAPSSADSLFRQWRSRDEASARRWLENATISPELHEQLSRQIKSK